MDKYAIDILHAAKLALILCRELITKVLNRLLYCLYENKSGFFMTGCIQSTINRDITCNMQGKKASDKKLTAADKST